MKKFIVSLLLCVGILSVGCGGSDPIADTWTRNLLPLGNYTVGSSTNPYYAGYFTNLYFNPASMANASAMNNSIYFSTDSNTLCYKNASGTVFSLY